MDTPATEVLLRKFRDLKDPRAANARHALSDIISIAILAVFCDCQTWTEVCAWARFNIQWLGTFLELRHGIPSHDTFDRLFKLLDPNGFEACFMAWTADLAEQGPQRLIAVDGKSLRQSWRHAWSHGPVHMVSAFYQQNRMVLGQVSTDGKSNEITAIPRLLALLDIKQATVTIDAMGCQREIAEQIVRQDGHYILALKGNQPTLESKARSLMKDLTLSHAKGEKDVPVDVFEHREPKQNHGRQEWRRTWITHDLEALGEVRAQWPGLSSIIMVESHRVNLGCLDEDGQVEVRRQQRFYISSHQGMDAAWMAQAVRGHWCVENDLHWSLDVAMHEDQCRLRAGNGAENFSRLRRIALNKLKRWEPKDEKGRPMKVGLKTKQKCCGWTYQNLLEAVLA
jgi:predicted transposase YbfD/YdcC